MKVVINRCFGGFGLSAKAIQRIAELQGKPCYFFKSEYTKKNVTYKPITIEETESAFIYNVFTIPNPNELSSEEINSRWDEINITDFHDDRVNPILVQVIEELGSEIASEKHASLKIVEIPNDIQWTIDDYDGMETVEEVHNSWS